MRWTETLLTEKCKEACKRVDVEFNTPVKINGRLTSTLGRVKYERVGLFIKPSVVEFSKSFLENYSDYDVEQTILHEMSHYCVSVITGEHHGHDDAFREMCLMLGTTANTATATNLTRTVPMNEIYKYTVKCKNCGNECGYHRAGKVVKALQNSSTSCKCGRCGSCTLELIQNR